MPASRTTSRASGKSPKSKTKLMTDAAVSAKTGRTWTEWFAILDKAGGRKMDHKQIVAHLDQRYKVGPWWQQMVTVGYEQSRGLRKVHERPDGFSISRSKTVAVPVARLYRVWSEPKQRASWLSDPDFTVRTSTANKSLRITWIDGKTTVETNFYPKGMGKSQVTVQHNKLKDAAYGERMKKYWGKQLDQMVRALNG